MANKETSSKHEWKDPYTRRMQGNDLDNSTEVVAAIFGGMMNH